MIATERWHTTIFGGKVYTPHARHVKGGPPRSSLARAPGRLANRIAALEWAAMAIPVGRVVSPQETVESDYSTEEDEE